MRRGGLPAGKTYQNTSPKNTAGDISSAGGTQFNDKAGATGFSQARGGQGAAAQ